MTTIGDTQRTEQAGPDKGDAEEVISRLAPFLSRRSFKVTRTGTILAAFALVSIALPWANFLVIYAPTSPGAPLPTPGQGASNLFGVASGLEDLGPAADRVSGGLVWFVIILALIGAILTAYHPFGGLFLLSSVLLYGLPVHGQLAAAGSELAAPVSFSFGVGLWLALLAAGLRLIPLVVATVGTRAEGAPPPLMEPTPVGAAPTPVVVQGPSAGPPHDLLYVHGLTVRFFTYDGVLKALDGVTFSVKEREIFGIVGETGCGKSVTAKAILRLIPDPPGRITAGEILFEGINLLDSIEDEAKIKVNAKGRARVRRNRRITKRVEAVMRTIRGNEISMIFQEPTAALNPVLTVEEQIGEAFMAHQMGEMCAAVESRQSVNGLQRHFFSLLRRREAQAAELEDLSRALSGKRAQVRQAVEASDPAAAAAVRAEIDTIERRMLRLTASWLPSWAVVALYVGTLFVGFHLVRKAVSLDGRIWMWQKIPYVGRNVLMEPIKGEARRRVVEILKQVNIADPESKAQAYPFELSGGMQQRAMIAMALACRPHLLLADEPTTALDVTIQAQILTLIRNLRDQFGSSVILITHDLGVVAETCERVGVMYAGVMAEIGASDDIFSRPKHPYTVGLLRSIPETYERTGKLSIIPGNVPSLLTPPEGCRFHPRCPFAADACKKVVPTLVEPTPGHYVACHLYDHPEFFPPERIKQRDAGLDQSWEVQVTP